MQPDPRDYEIRIWYSAEKGDECFIAQVVEWPGIMAHGETREEAARQIQLALEGALQVGGEQGIKPPSPALAHASLFRHVSTLQRFAVLTHPWHAIVARLTVLLGKSWLVTA